MKTRKSLYFLMLAAVAVLLFAGCQRANVPVEGPQGYIGVVFFNQPETSSELLAGYIPENAKPVKTEVLEGLDMQLREALAESGTTDYVRPGAALRCTHIVISRLASVRATASLDQWVGVGMCLGVDYLLVPQLLYWQERDGSEVAVREPAAVVLDLFLVDVNAGTIAARYHFDEEQLSLTENILEADKFVKRKGKWITATELAREGISRGVKELGL
ncbi:lipoprotein [Desulfobaculum senezii]|jgi:hypothetical protein